METGDVPHLVAPPGPWAERAACTTADPELFFPNRRAPGAGEEAKAICARCPARADCLEYALATRQEWGVRGGTNEHERQAILRGRNRPPSPPGTPKPPKAGAA